MDKVLCSHPGCSEIAEFGNETAPYLCRKHVKHYGGELSRLVEYKGGVPDYDNRPVY